MEPAALLQRPKQSFLETKYFAAERKTKVLILLLFPVGMLLVTAMMLRAGYRCVKNGGIDWRGTHYPIEQLRAGQRVKF